MLGSRWRCIVARKKGKGLSQQELARLQSEKKSPPGGTKGDYPKKRRKKKQKGLLKSKNGRRVIKPELVRDIERRWEEDENYLDDTAL